MGYPQKKKAPVREPFGAGHKIVLEGFSNRRDRSLGWTTRKGTR